MTNGEFKRADLSTITCGPSLFMMYADGSNSLGLVIHHDWTFYGLSHYGHGPFSPLADLSFPSGHFLPHERTVFITRGPLPAACVYLLRLRGALPLVPGPFSFSRIPADIFGSLSLRVWTLLSTSAFYPDHFHHIYHDTCKPS